MLFCRGDEFWNPQLAKRSFTRIFQEPEFFFAQLSFVATKVFMKIFSPTCMKIRTFTWNGTKEEKVVLS